MEYVVVDTNIWEYAYALPRDKAYNPLHEMARAFLFDLLGQEDMIVCMNSYQICEVLEVFRKIGVNRSIRREILEAFKEGKFAIEELSPRKAAESCEKSMASGIHIYDYLVVSFEKFYLDRIYSADKHFQHQDFHQVAEVVNPLEGWWVVEGRLPEKENR